MSNTRTISGYLIPLGLMLVGGYFAFAAVQGDYGLFRRIQVEARIDRLETELAAVTAERRSMQVLALRLSDDYLDLDLLDEQARDVLGLMRADEIVLP